MKTLFVPFLYPFKIKKKFFRLYLSFSVFWCTISQWKKLYTFSTIIVVIRCFLLLRSSMRNKSPFISSRILFHKWIFPSCNRQCFFAFFWRVFFFKWRINHRTNTSSKCSNMSLANEFENEWKFIPEKFHCASNFHATTQWFSWIRASFHSLFPITYIYK